MAENLRLAELMREAGFLAPDGSIGKKVFARAVSDESARRKSARTYTHTYVGRWLDGTVPRDKHTRECVAAALSRKLGRLVSLDEIGFGRGEVPAHLGLRYGDDVSQNVDTVLRLWQADLDEVRGLVDSGVNAAAWNEASLNWLVGSRTTG